VVNVGRSDDGIRVQLDVKFDDGEEENYELPKDAAELRVAATTHFSVPADNPPSITSITETETRREERLCVPLLPFHTTKLEPQSFEVVWEVLDITRAYSASKKLKFECKMAHKTESEGKTLDDLKGYFKRGRLSSGSRNHIANLLDRLAESDKCEQKHKKGVKNAAKELRSCECRKQRVRDDVDNSGGDDDEPSAKKPLPEPAAESASAVVMREPDAQLKTDSGSMKVAGEEVAKAVSASVLISSIGFSDLHSFCLVRRNRILFDCISSRFQSCLVPNRVLFA
jgi:hypothetical protein